MRNTYVTLDALKATGNLNVTGSAYDSRLLILIENVSQEIDGFLNRIIYPYIATLYFTGDGSTAMLVPDLIGITSLKEDTNADGTFETTWTGTNGTDFFLAPLNANPTSQFDAKPYTKIIVNTMNSNGSQDLFLKGQRNYQIVGTFGFSHVARDYGNVCSASLAASGSITLTTAGTAWEVGQTVLIDSEWIYIKAVTTGTALTVDRGVNGSTAAVHASGTVAAVVTYPGPIQEAAMIQAARIWKRRESAYSNLVGMDQTGQIAVFTGGLDGDVKALLQPYRKFSV